MESPGAVGRRRGTSRSNVEDQALDQIAKEVRAISVQSKKKKKTIKQTNQKQLIRSKNKPNNERTNAKRTSLTECF